jgi:dynein heavy chain
MESFQDDYNADPQYVGGNKKQMKLVMFLDACEHISRISRIIRQPQGNALILGVGGSGRQSLSKMASFIMNYKIFQIEVVKNYNMRTWREDVKKCLMMAGVDNKPVSFLFVDTQIITEQFLEDINNILNSGDVTNIYQEKDMEEIQTACKQDCIKRNMQPNKMNIFSCYI